MTRGGAVARRPVVHAASVAASGSTASGAITEQGSEHLADIIAWGLMDVESRGVPQLPANSVSELTAAFVMLTRGGALPPVN